MWLGVNICDQFQRLKQHLSLQRLVGKQPIGSRMDDRFDLLLKHKSMCQRFLGHEMIFYHLKFHQREIGLSCHWNRIFVKNVLETKELREQRKGVVPK
jgi:hypothetical protein